MVPRPKFVGRDHAGVVDARQQARRRIVQQHQRLAGPRDRLVRVGHRGVADRDADHGVDRLLRQPLPAPGSARSCRSRSRPPRPPRRNTEAEHAGPCRPVSLVRPVAGRGGGGGGGGGVVCRTTATAARGRRAPPRPPPPTSRFGRPRTARSPCGPQTRDHHAAPRSSIVAVLRSEGRPSPFRRFTAAPAARPGHPPGCATGPRWRDPAGRAGGAACPG